MKTIQLPPDVTAIGISISADRTLITPLHDANSSLGFTFDAIVWLNRPTKSDQQSHLPALRHSSQQIFLR